MCLPAKSFTSPFETSTLVNTSKQINKEPVSVVNSVSQGGGWKLYQLRPRRAAHHAGSQPDTDLEEIAFPSSSPFIHFHTNQIEWKIIPQCREPLPDFPFGASIKDIRKIFLIFLTPSPRRLHLEPICSTKLRQPSLLHPLFHEPLPLRYEHHIWRLPLWMRTKILVKKFFWTELTKELMFRL